MKLTPPAPYCIEVEMPMAFEGMSDSEAKSQVSKRNVCAFAYRPLAPAERIALRLGRLLPGNASRLLVRSSWGAQG